MLAQRLKNSKGYYLVFTDGNQLFGAPFATLTEAVSEGHSCDFGCRVHVERREYRDNRVVSSEKVATITETVYPIKAIG